MGPETFFQTERIAMDMELWEFETLCAFAIMAALLVYYGSPR